MNSDIYYLKYIKYKTKYINEKKKLGGGCNDIEINNELIKLKLHEKIIYNFNLLKDGKYSKINIEESIKKIFLDNVLNLKKLDKKCLKVQLALNLNKNYTLLDKFINFSFGDGEYTSLNINVLKSEFSRGTAFIYEKPSYKERDNLRFLTNIINIKYKIPNPEYNKTPDTEYNKTPDTEYNKTPDTTDNKIIESMRFGTPYTPTNIDFYKTQIRLLKDYVENKRCLFISLLDVCDSRLCSFGGEKKNENDIIHEEIKGYSVDNIVYLNMACNNSVNLTDSLSKVSDKKLSFQLSEFFSKLEKWIDGSNNEALKILKSDFFNKFRKNVLDNDSSDKDLIKELSIQKFVLKKEINGSINLNSLNSLNDFLNNENIMNYIPCQENLTNENIRLVMLCYISLIYYILSRESKKSKEPNIEYILLYHCKSGQDRTGTFYAINQMINEITTNHYNNIVTDITKSEHKLSFIQIFKKYYSLIKSESTETTKSIETTESTKKDCPKVEELNKIVLNNNINNINEEVELCYLKYLFYSYNIALTSTGCPGIKWSLANTELPIKFFDKRKYFSKLEAPVDNRFPYLLLSNPYLPILFEGASSMRGS